MANGDFDGSRLVGCGLLNDVLYLGFTWSDVGVYDEYEDEDEDEDEDESGVDYGDGDEYEDIEAR